MSKSVIEEIEQFEDVQEVKDIDGLWDTLRAARDTIFLLNQRIVELEHDRPGWERYKVLPGSRTAHCCFDATVVDSQDPDSGSICECFEMSDAEMICKALNDTAL